MDSILTTIMAYTINTGLLTAICILASFVSGLVARNTQFELSFIFILPELYVNSYLGSLNNRTVMHSSRKTIGPGRTTIDGVALGTIVRVERTTERGVDLESASLPRKDSGLVHDTNVDVDAWMYGPANTRMAARD